MREIKFRAWDKYFKQITEVISINFKLRTVKVIKFGSKDKDDIYETTLDDLELLQYTGLKDKNGKEIWGGDVVRYRNRLYVIYYQGASYMIKPYDKEAGLRYPIGEISVELEIVSTIYENPKLLKS